MSDNIVLKTCVTCRKYTHKNNVFSSFICCDPRAVHDNGIDMVTGERNDPSNYQDCWIQRSELFDTNKHIIMCGSAGNWWEPRTQEQLDMDARKSRKDSL